MAETFIAASTLVLVGVITANSCGVPRNSLNLANFVGRSDCSGCKNSSQLTERYASFQPPSLLGRKANDAGVGMPVGADEPLHKRATWSSLGSTTAQVEVKRLASGHSPKTLPSELLPQRRLTSSSPCLNVTAKSRWKRSENRNDKHSTPFVHVAMIVPPGSAPRRGMLAVGEYFIKHSKPEREYASNGEP